MRSIWCCIFAIYEYLEDGGKHEGLRQWVLLSFSLCVYTTISWSNLISFSPFFRYHYRWVFLVTCIWGSVFRALSKSLIIHLLLSYFILFHWTWSFVRAETMFIFTVVSAIASAAHLLSSHHFLIERKWIRRKKRRKREGLLGPHKLVQVYRMSGIWTRATIKEIGRQVQKRNMILFLKKMKSSLEIQ